MLKEHCLLYQQYIFLLIPFGSGADLEHLQEDYNSRLVFGIPADEIMTGGGNNGFLNNFSNFDFFFKKRLFAHEYMWSEVTYLYYI